MFKYPIGPPGILRCPHCNRKLGLFKKMERCAYSGEVICSKCIVGGRFSDSVFDKIPREYQQKFRFFNLLPFVSFIIAGLWLMQNAFWSNSGWKLDNLNTLLYQLLGMIGFLAAGITLIFVSFRLPPMGSWMFYRWINKPKNLEKVRKAVELKETGNYCPSSAMFRKRVEFFDYLKKSNFKIVFYVALISNSLILPLYFTIRTNMALAGTYLSAIAGINLIVAIVSMIMVAIVSSGYYCSKQASNRVQKRVVEILSGSYIILLPIYLFSQVIALLAQWEVLSDIKPEWGAPAILVATIALVIQPFVAIALNCFLLFKAKPDYDPSHNLMPAERKKVKKQMVKYFFKGFGLILLIGGVLLFLGLALIILIADVTMALCVLSSIYFLFGAVIPLTYFTLKLMKRGNNRFNQPFWTMAKVCVIIVGINLVPVIGTSTWTNWNVDRQFDQVFGPDWESQIPGDLADRMRDVKFSWFDAFYGFDVEVNAMYTIPYCQDSPRYVKLNNGTVLSNGSSKYTGILDTFVFDAYLPQWLDFNDSSMEKLPVIILFHGVGMDFGSGNANVTSQYLANQGYLVCDMMYGFVDWRKANTVSSFTNESGRPRRKGYDFPDTIQHVGNFTKFLKANEDYYHADMNNVFFSGRSFGGWMAAVCAYGYNSTYFGTNFSSNMKVSGCISYYGAHGILSGGSDNFLYSSGGASNIRGSSNPDDPDFNPDWIHYDPLQLVKSSVSGSTFLCPTISFQGTNDYLVIAGWTKMLDKALKANGHDSIAAYYPLGSHGFDAVHFSQYGQSIIYWFERFLALTTT
ncbi:MAG: alpha/beta hydrolase family protein [Promethearchaeota archaeon]